MRPPLSIDVRIESPEVEVHRELGHDELGNRWSHSVDGRLSGLTSSKFEIGSVAEYSILRVGNRHCFWVEKVRVILRIRTLDVYIARDYAPGSCPYKAVLDHERAHVATAKRSLEEYAPRFRAALASPLIPKASSPLMVESPMEAKRDTQELIGLLLAPVAERLKTEMAEAQAELDTPEEYRRVHDRCQD